MKIVRTLAIATLGAVSLGGCTVYTRPYDPYVVVDPGPVIVAPAPLYEPLLFPRWDGPRWGHHHRYWR